MKKLTTLILLFFSFSINAADLVIDPDVNPEFTLRCASPPRFYDDGTGGQGAPIPADTAMDFRFDRGVKPSIYDDSVTVLTWCLLNVDATQLTDGLYYYVSRTLVNGGVSDPNTEFVVQVQRGAIEPPVTSKPIKPGDIYVTFPDPGVP